MLLLSQMIGRFILAIVLGSVIGWERELIGKEAGIRTSMLVASGAAIFAMIGTNVPGASNALANIVVGIGFLGAGIIFVDRERVHGLTTAAVIWATAAIGALCGTGFNRFAVFVTLFLALTLYLLRRLSVGEDARKPTSKKP